MSCDCEPPQEGERLWWSADGLHLDVRGLPPPEPMVKILSLIDGGQVEGALIVHLDREPIFLYPELEDRGWSHEIVQSSCGDPGCDEDVKLRLVRWG